jgi:hypothetical protein
MHKRNTVLIALAYAAVITLVVSLWTSVHRSDAVGIVYFPAIMLSILFSGGSRSIGAVSEWSSFVVYTLFYLIVFLVVYVLLLEAYLLRRGFVHLQPPSGGEGQATESNSQTRLDQLGRAIHDVESKRRKHWLLDDTKSIDLTEAPDKLAARALDAATVRGPTKGLLKEYKARIVKQRGPEAAEAEIAKLRADAKIRVENDFRDTGSVSRNG